MAQRSTGRFVCGCIFFFVGLVIALVPHTTEVEGLLAGVALSVLGGTLAGTGFGIFVVWEKRDAPR